MKTIVITDDAVYNRLAKIAVEYADDEVLAALGIDMDLIDAKNDLDEAVREQVAADQRFQALFFDKIICDFDQSGFDKHAFRKTLEEHGITYEYQNPVQIMTGHVGTAKFKVRKTLMSEEQFTELITKTLNETD